MNDLVFATASEQARAIATGEASSLALVDAYLARIERFDGGGGEGDDGIGAFLAVDAAGARDRARAVDAAVAAGDDVGPLGGVPIALKDVMVTQGLATTAGSRILEGWMPPYDGTAVARLRAAGAVLLGKLNMDEFAMGSSTENSAYRPCRNPWNRDRVPGGSSGGSAAAVAAGLCAASFGTDTGGSIRQPAAMCGVVGVKPTYGRVSRYGLIAFASSLDQIGPLARSVEDAALLLEVVSGFDPLDATSIDEPVPGYRDALGAGVQGLTIGLPDEYFDAGAREGVDPEVAEAVRGAVAWLEAAGARTVRIALPHTEYGLAAYYLIATAEASSNLARFDGVRYGARGGQDGPDTGAGSLADMYCRARGAGFGAEVKRRIMLGTFALRTGYYDAYYRKAQQARALISRDFERAFAACDLIAAPVTPTAAFALGAKTASPLEMYLADVFTLNCNLAGLPGMSVPCGFTSERLPIGLQLLAPPLAESTMLRAAAQVERAAGSGGARPPGLEVAS